MSREAGNCARCNKTEADSPRRRFVDGFVCGWCIACEQAHDRKVQEERDAAQINAGNRRYEVVYYKKILCFERVWAKNKDAAKDAIYTRVKEKEKDGLHQFTVQQVTETNA